MILYKKHMALRCFQSFVVAIRYSQHPAPMTVVSIRASSPTTASAMIRAVSIAHHHPRRERQRARSALGVATFERRKIHEPDRIENQVHEIRFCDPVRHVHRQQKTLPATRFTVEIGHLAPQGLRSRPTESDARTHVIAGGRFCNRLQCLHQIFLKIRQIVPVQGIVPSWRGLADRA